MRLQLIVNIQNDSIANKIIDNLNVFKDDGVEINQVVFKENKTKFSDEYIKKHWKELGMNTHSANLDDDERLYDAAWEFYSEKHSN